MTIFELAAELGKALKEDEKLIRLEKAKEAYQSDKDLQKALAEDEAVKSYIDEAQQSKFVRGNCILIPLSLAKAEEMIETFNKGK